MLSCQISEKKACSLEPLWRWELISLKSSWRHGCTCFFRAVTGVGWMLVSLDPLWRGKGVWVCCVFMCAEIESKVLHLLCHCFTKLHPQPWILNL